MTLHEKLVVYETVVLALRQQHDLTRVLSKFPLNYQIEAMKFMEALNNGTTEQSGQLDGARTQAYLH